MTKPQPATLTSYMRARKLDGSECTINLMDLEDALNGVFPGTAYLLPDSGRIVFRDDSDYFDEEEPEDDDDKIPDDVEILEIDRLPSHVQFEWMEEFSESVHSITLRTSLGRALRERKPFRNFKDALLEYPMERERWFEFHAKKLKNEAVALIESFDWEILEVVHQRPRKAVEQTIELAERLPLTSEETEAIL